MRVMVMVKATESSELGKMPDEQLLADMGKFNEELINAGIMKSGDGLKPSSEGKRVHFSGPNRTVVDGPFAETKELIAGYWLWEVQSMEEAVEWVKRCPNPMIEDSDIEIRPVYEIEDFAEIDPSGELREQEEKLRERLEADEGKAKPNRNPIGWFEIYVADIDRSRAFYEKVLGVSLTKLDSPNSEIELYAFPMEMDAPGASGALVKNAECTPRGNGTLVYFTCEDCSVEESRVESAGGKVQCPKMAIGQYGFISLAIDPEGNVFGLHSLK